MEFLIDRIKFLNRQILSNLLPLSKLLQRKIVKDFRFLQLDCYWLNCCQCSNMYVNVVNVDVHLPRHRIKLYNYKDVDKNIAKSNMASTQSYQGL